MKKLVLFLGLCGALSGQTIPAGPGVFNLSGGSGSGGSGTVGPGTTNTMAKFTAATTVGDSLATDDGTTLSYTGTGGGSFVGSLATGVGGTNAGALALGQGTAPSTGTTNITLYAPTSVTSWKGRLPGAAASGVLQGTNTAGDVVFGFSSLTSGRVTFATTNGLLSDDADMTFATDTLTVTKIIGSTSITDNGNLIFGSTSQRITGDMTNATVGSRLYFQTTTADSTTALGIMPSGAGTQAQLNLINSSTATNAAVLKVYESSSASIIDSAHFGSGTTLDLIWAIDGTTKVTLSASTGNVLFAGALSIGTSNALTAGTIELGAAADTTLSRVSAGVVAIEGVNIVTTTSPVMNGTTYTTATASSPGYIGMPQNSQSTAYTTVLGDQGKHILHPTADNNARTITIDSNANVAYPIGTVITIVNQINTVTVAITSDTLTWFAGSGTASTGSRTLAAGGVATLLKVGTTSWIISGPGVS